MDLDVGAELTVVVKTRQDGINESAPSHYIVESLQGSTPPFNRIDELTTYLRRQVYRQNREREREIKRLMSKHATSPLSTEEEFHLAQLRELKVRIRPDGRLRFGFVTEVMDSCVQAGFTTIAFAAPTGAANVDK
jgi:hypothetical protein